MFEPRLPSKVADIHFDDPAFWSSPLEQREGAFALLRREQPMSFHQEFVPPPEIPLPRGPGYWSVTRHADVLTASRKSDVFCSGRGIQIPDLPPALTEFFGSMISMDDPRHARLRSIVSRGFTPRALGHLQGDVELRAKTLIDAVIEQGECDFVTKIAAPLPLGIICDMMGIPESQTQFVFDQTNIILGLGDPEYVTPGTNPLVAALTSGQAL
ncbi:MAG: cytochrome P450, partial [Myxococcota bacterium]